MAVPHAHPSLVGLALCFFFLLLSLPEHLPFLQTYAGAAAAVVLLLDLYARHMLGRSRSGWLFGLASDWYRAASQALQTLRMDAPAGAPSGPPRGSHCSSFALRCAGSTGLGS